MRKGKVDEGMDKSRGGWSLLMAQQVDREKQAIRQNVGTPSSPSNNLLAELNRLNQPISVAKPVAKPITMSPLRLLLEKRGKS